MKRDRHAHEAGTNSRRPRTPFEVGRFIYYLVGGDKAKAALASLKGWVAVNNAAVMAVLLLLFGVKLIGEGLPALF
jgi:hypothetical protein